MGRRGLRSREDRRLDVGLAVGLGEGSMAGRDCRRTAPGSLIGNAAGCRRLVVGVGIDVGEDIGWVGAVVEHSSGRRELAEVEVLDHRLVVAPHTESAVAGDHRSSAGHHNHRLRNDRFSTWFDLDVNEVDVSGRRYSMMGLYCRKQRAMGMPVAFIRTGGRRLSK